MYKNSRFQQSAHIHVHPQ